MATAPGVHQPSPFSALLASTLNDVEGCTVIDAGCGSGLITIAALASGAKRVIALDCDPTALQVTTLNVETLLGYKELSRVDGVVGAFADLSSWNADLLAVNPPQRPSQILNDVEPENRHLHDGGGDDGLAPLSLDPPMSWG